MRYLSFLTLLIGLIVCNCANAVQPIPDEILKMMLQPQYANSTWTLYVKDLNTNKVEYNLNAAKFFLPASVSKLFAVAALLNTYGDKGSIQTPVYALGEISDSGQLEGNLILVAKGDLILGGRALAGNKIAYTNMDHVDANSIPGVELTPEDPLAGLQSLAQQVKNSGIKSIKGSVIIDTRLFDSYTQRHVNFSPILINENLIDIEVSPGEVNSLAKISWRPQVSSIEVVNKVMTVAENQPSRVIIKSNKSGTLIEVVGNISVNNKHLVNTYPIQNPQEFAQEAFIHALEQQGIKIEEETDVDEDLPEVDAYKTLKPVAVLDSPEMLEYAKLILKVSHNIGANLIPALLASYHGKTSYADGMQYMNQFLLNTAHVDVKQIAFGSDAAGGNDNRVTAIAVMQLLEYFYHQPPSSFESTLYTLPILGKDGSLAGVAQNMPAKEHVFAKTGTGAMFNRLDGQLFLTTKSLAGFYQDKNKHWKAFVLAINNAPLKQVEDIFTINNDLGMIAAFLYARGSM